MKLTEESDRGAVLIGATMLDSDLENILRKLFKQNCLSNKQIKDMFDLDGPLSTFSSKALIRYVFGLISKESFNDISIIRKLRNKFAHSQETISFSSDGIKDQLQSIEYFKEAAKGFERRGIHLHHAENAETGKAL